MNKIFKIVFNAARGKMMVVNEATSSIQSGKNKAVAIAVGTTLALASFGASALQLDKTLTFTKSTQSDYYLNQLDDKIEITSEKVGIDFNSSTQAQIVGNEAGNRVGQVIVNAGTTGLQVAGKGNFTIQADEVSINGTNGAGANLKGATTHIDANSVNLSGTTYGIIDQSTSAKLTITADELTISGGKRGIQAQYGLIDIKADTVEISNGTQYEYAIWTRNTGKVSISGKTDIKGIVTNEGTLSLSGETTAHNAFNSTGTLNLGKDAQLTLTESSLISGTFLSEKGSVIKLEDGVMLSLWNKGRDEAVSGAIEDLTIEGNGDVDIWKPKASIGIGYGVNTLDVRSLNIEMAGRGITAYGTNTVTADTITIKTESDGIHAMGDANGVVKLTADTISVAAGASSYAIQNASNNKKENVVLNGKDVTLTSDGRTAISQQGAGSTVVTAENLVIEGFMKGYDSKVNAVNISNGTLSLTGTETVSISNGKGGASTNAIGVEAAGTLNVTGGDVTVSGKTNVAGVLSMDADSVTLNESLVSNNGEVSLVGDTVSVTSATDVAIRLVDADVDISANKVVIASDTNWHGVRAKQSTAVIDADDVAISSQYAGVYAEYGSQVTLGNDESTSVKIDVTSKGEDSAVAGLWTNYKDSVITVKGQQLEINVTGVEGVNAYGILAQGQAEGNSVVIDAENTVINATNGGVFATGKAQVDINGALDVNAKNVVVARGESTVNINQAGGNDVVLNGDINFNKGNHSGTDAWADVNITLDTANSVWNGGAKVSWDVLATAEDFSGSKLNLSLANGAQWNPVTIEAQGTLGVTETGQMGLDISNMNIESGLLKLRNGVQVDVVNLEGSGGTVEIGTENGATDAALNVANLDEDTKLDVNLMNADLTQELTSDDITGVQAQAILANVAGGAAGVSTEVKEGLFNGAMTVNGQDGVVATATNSVMSNVLDLASASTLSMNRFLMNDVRKRMGDLRSAEGTHGAWARYDGGKLSGANGHESDFTTVQVGIDTVPVADAPRFGVAFAYTQTDADMKRGGAEMDAFSLAFYGTKMYNNGMFVDVIGRMATADTDVTVDGDKKGSMDNVALSLSGEFGWRFDVTNQFYVEPQAEMTYTYVNADKLDLDGNVYAFDSVDSLLGRVGFAAGFKCPSNFGDVYVRASVVHEFLGDAAVMGANGTVHAVDGKDTWVEFGIGANFNVNKNTYVYADIERTEGAKLEEDWRANVGVRFAF